MESPAIHTLIIGKDKLVVPDDELEELDEELEELEEFDEEVEEELDELDELVLAVWLSLPQAEAIKTTAKTATWRKHDIKISSKILICRDFYDFGPAINWRLLMNIT